MLGLGISSLALPATASTTLYYDNFDAGTWNTDATVNELSQLRTFSGVAPVENAGQLIVKTSSAGAWSETTVGFNFSDQLNFYQAPIEVRIRDFVLGGGSNPNPNANFRIGLVGTTGGSGIGSGTSFYGSDDAVALRISNEGRIFNLAYKTDMGSKVTTPHDPNLTVSSGTLNSKIVGFDWYTAVEEWKLTFYLEDETQQEYSGAWTVNNFAGLNAETDWGHKSASDTYDVGASALIMYAQNATGTADTGISQFSIGSLEVLNVPEPTRALLCVAAIGYMTLRRRKN